ncbi:MAG: TetR family transcriptional regulator [Actinomycetota bacterium]
MHDTRTAGETSTRDRLEAAALTLFEQHGFDAVTTEQIAAAAGVSTRTFFRHFPTKIDALLGDIDARTLEFALRLHRQPPDLGLNEALIAAITEEEAEATGASMLPADLVRARVLRGTPSLADEIRTYEAKLERHIAEWIGQRTGHDADDFRIRVAAGAYVAARRVVVEEWQRSGGTAPVVDLARRSLETVHVTIT